MPCNPRNPLENADGPPPASHPSFPRGGRAGRMHSGALPCQAHSAHSPGPSVGPLPPPPQFRTYEAGGLRRGHYTMVTRSFNPKFSEAAALGALCEAPILSGLGFSSWGRGQAPLHTHSASPRPQRWSQGALEAAPPPPGENTPSPCPHHAGGRDLARRSLPPRSPPFTRPPAATPSRATTD